MVWPFHWVAMTKARGVHQRRNALIESSVWAACRRVSDPGELVRLTCFCFGSAELDA